MATKKIQNAQLIMNLVLILAYWISVSGLFRVLENASLNKSMLTGLGVEVPPTSSFICAIGTFLLRHHWFVFLLYTTLLLVWGSVCIFGRRRFNLLLPLRQSLILSILTVFVSVLLGLAIWFICWWLPLRGALQIGF